MKYLTRRALIDRLREHLLGMTDDETSICTVAARKGIFCKGFAHYTDQELRTQFDWIANRRPNATREQLEDVINKYKVARSQALGTVIACDASMIDRDTCVGWDEFTDADLSRFHQDWFGEPVQVVAPDWDPSRPAAPASKSRAS